MVKATYTAAKGLVQASGRGFRAQQAEGNYVARNFKYITTSDDHDYSALETGDWTIVVNFAQANTKYIRLPEATTANAGMNIRVIYLLAPAALHHLGFVTTAMVGGAAGQSDATEGHCDTNTWLQSSAVGTANLRLDIDVNDAGKCIGHPGTVVDFHYVGVENVVVTRVFGIGDVDTGTGADLFSTTAVNA